MEDSVPKKTFLGMKTKPNKELLELLSNLDKILLKEEDMLSQRLSFAFGNAPEGSDVTKDSILRSSKTFKLSA